MRTAGRSILPLFIVLLGATGCAPAVNYRPGGPAPLVKAPATGVYELYRRGAQTPVYSTVLLKHDRLGFARDADGRLVAVANGERYALPEAKYRWKFEGYDGRQRGLRVDPRYILVAAPVLLAEAALAMAGAAAEAGITKAIDSTENSGLTKYQRRKLERIRQADP